MPIEAFNYEWAVKRLEYVFHSNRFESDGNGASTDYDFFGFDRKEFADFLSHKVGEPLDLFCPMPEPKTDTAPAQNTATPAPVKDVGAPDGAISLEQVNQAFIEARFWISRARIRQAVTPVELLALVIEYHHHGDKNKFVTDWYQALRAAVSAGSTAARDVDSLIPLSPLPAGDKWLVTVHDAEQFIRSIGLGWSVTKAIEHVFAECFPPVPEPQPTTPSPALVEDVGALDGDTQDIERIRYEVLASRTQLIDAFSFYGVELKIFKALKDRPRLYAARRVKGQGKKSEVAEPQFCPYEVMNWLIEDGVKDKPKLSSFNAWHILETKFPSVYAEKSIGDPRPN